MNDLDDTTFARFAERFAWIEQQVPEPPPHEVRKAIESRGRRPLSPVAGLVGVMILLAAAVGLAVIGSQLSPRPSPSAATVTIPPDSAPPAVVLDAYLRALQAGDCGTATQLTIPVLFRVGNGDLCGVTGVTAFSVSGDPHVVSPVEVAFLATLAITGTAHGLSAGDVTWFYILQQQSSGAWRIVDGIPGAISSSMLPTPPTR